MTQWHLIGPSRAAHDLIRDCSSYNARVGDVVLVFDMMWRKDHELWLSVQKAGSEPDPTANSHPRRRGRK